MTDTDIRLLIAEDEEHLGAILEHFLTSRGYAVTMCRDGRSALTALRTGRYDVALLDIVMPELDGLEVLRQLQAQEDPPEVITITGNGTIDTAITAIKLGAYDYISKPYRMAEIDVMVRRAWEKRELLRANDFLRSRVSAAESVALAAESPRMRELVQRVAALATSREPIVIRGEVGVGKTHLARYIHAHSNRRADVYVEVGDRDAIPDLKAFLFGEESANASSVLASNGAHGGMHNTAPLAVSSHPGLFQRAARGTVVLDLDIFRPDERAALAKALEEMEFTKIGGSDRIPLSARVILCERTQGDTAVSPSDAAFGTVLTVPPLRNRVEDYGILASQLVRASHGRAGTVAPDVATVLSSYAWPANVRELRAVLARASMLASSAQLSEQDVRVVLGAGSVTSAVGRDDVQLVADEPSYDASVAALADLERAHIEAMLIRSNWHQGRAAQALGISTKTLYRKMREYGFIRPRKRKFARTTRDSASREETGLEHGRVFSSPLASGPGPSPVAAGALASSGMGDRHSE